MVPIGTFLEQVVIIKHTETSTVFILNTLKLRIFSFKWKLGKQIKQVALEVQQESLSKNPWQTTEYYILTSRPLLCAWWIHLLPSSEKANKEWRTCAFQVVILDYTAWRWWHHLTLHSNWVMKRDSKVNSPTQCYVLPYSGIRTVFHHKFSLNKQIQLQNQIAHKKATYC